jgi:hypothetical protein
VASSGSWDKLAALVLAPLGPRDVFVEGRAIVRDGDLVLNAAGEVVSGRAGRAGPADGIATIMGTTEATMATAALPQTTSEAGSGPSEEQRRDPAYVPPLPMAIALGAARAGDVRFEHHPPIIVSRARPGSASARPILPR